MKILLLAPGTSIHTKRWANSLCERGFGIVIFSITRFDKKDYNKQITIYDAQLDIKSIGNRFFSQIEYLKTLFLLRKILKKEQPDILHAHYASSYGLLGALTRFKPYIISVWGSDVYEFPNISILHRSILRYNLSCANKILSTSHVMAQETKKYTSKKIAVTPFGVDIENFKKRVIEKNNEFVVGNVKSLDKKYGIDVLIQAFKLVVNNNPDKALKLQIIGEGPDRGKLEQLTKDLGIESMVQFLGKIKNDLLPEYYNSFSVSVSVSVSDSESFGVVAVEAMACECPVITSDADGFTEVVKDSVTGFIVPKRNPQKTADAIQRFIDNPELCKKMGIAGRRRVIELYEWNSNVDSMIAIYNGMNV